MAQPFGVFACFPAPLARVVRSRVPTDVGDRRFEVVELHTIEFNKLALDSALVGRTAAYMAAAAAAADADAPATAMSASDRFLRDSVGLLAGLRFTDAPEKQFLVGSAHLFWYDGMRVLKTCRRP